jgi:hypothetical protein
LLIGCGNSPLIPSNKPHKNESEEQFKKRYNEEHIHKDFITINPELTMNPTIVGAFGFDEGINKYLKEKNHKYNTFGHEAVTLMDFKNIENTPLLIDLFKNIFTDNFIINNVNGLVITKEKGVGLPGLEGTDVFNMDF